MTDTLTIESRRAVLRALHVLQIFRDLNNDTDIPIGEAIAFLHIAIGEKQDGSGMSVTALAKESGYSLAAASRYAQDLGEMDRRREPGLRLVTDQVDLMERRKKILRLTPKGQRVVANIVSAVNPKDGECRVPSLGAAEWPSEATQAPVMQDV